MAAFLPIAVLISLLAAGATADGYGSSPSPSTPPPHTPPPAPCAKRGSPSLDGAAALPGARVTVTCRDRKNRVMAWRSPAADYNGYFLAEFGVERAGDFFGKDPREACFVRLLSSPDAKCNVVTNINGGMGGASLRDEGKRWTDGRGIENVVYAAGPLAFRPEMCAPTRHY
ncbi:uncharacterized protein LOC101774223 [Setaria italica]|uniref:uncharacterized protein LOC101774223 n=1 Tax=Setaria italica TaxID=4555 RepID=UPI000645CF1F|nr:uncharacterized protein LOC101774223 [Setaria italica]